jgi:hypothetical protein
MQLMYDGKRWWVVSALREGHELFVGDRSIVIGVHIGGVELQLPPNYDTQTLPFRQASLFAIVPVTC